MSDTSHKCGGLRGHPHLRPPCYKFGCLHRFPQIQCFPEHFTELKKALYLYLQFYYSKRIEVRTSQRKRHMGQNWGTHTGVLQPGKFHFFRNKLLFQHWCVTICAEYWQPRTHIWVCVQSFYGDFIMEAD